MDSPELNLERMVRTLEHSDLAQTSKRVYRSHLIRFYEFSQSDDSNDLDQQCIEYINSLADSPTNLVPRQVIAKTTLAWLYQNVFKIDPHWTSEFDNLRLRHRPNLDNLMYKESDISKWLDELFVSDPEVSAMAALVYVTGQSLETVWHRRVSDIDMVELQVTAPYANGNPGTYNIPHWCTDSIETALELTEEKFKSLHRATLPDDPTAISHDFNDMWVITRSKGRQNEDGYRLIENPETSRLGKLYRETRQTSKLEPPKLQQLGSIGDFHRFLRGTPLFAAMRAGQRMNATRLALQERANEIKANGEVEVWLDKTSGEDPH